MTQRTKNTIALSLIGTAAALVLVGLGYSRIGSFSTSGTKALASPLVGLGVVAFLFFNWFLVRTLTGIRIFGFLSRDTGNRVSVRQFSWLLLLLTPLFLAGPVWLAATQGSTLLVIIGGAAFIALVFFYLLVPASDGTLAMKKFKASLPKTSK